MLRQPLKKKKTTNQNGSGNKGTIDNLEQMANTSKNPAEDEGEKSVLQTKDDQSTKSVELPTGKSDESDNNLNSEINRLRAEIARLEGLVKETGKTVTVIPETNASTLVIAADINRKEREDHNKLIRLAVERGPQMTQVVREVEKLTPFTSPLSIKKISTVPSLFQVETIGTGQTDINSTSLSGAPLYLARSAKDFGFGITEARFVMRSTGFAHQIDFSPSSKAVLLKDVVGLTGGPVNMESSKNDYILKICETLFLIYLDSQFVLTDVEFTTLFDRRDYSGDYVSNFSMIKTQYINQDVPVLPAASFGHKARYMDELICNMFQPSHHHMVIGERARDTLSQKKIFRRAGVITDQFTAELNELYLNYLNSRSIDYNSYIAQHKALTLPNVGVRVSKPSVFTSSLVPVWRRDECDGSLLLYALDISRQTKYLQYLSQLLMSTNLVSFATIEQVGDMNPRKNLKDQEVQQLIDNVLTSSNSHDFYRALSLDLSTTWIDARLSSSILENDPLSHIFKIFIVLLWYAYFPSVARDNAPRLMYELFTSLEQLVDKKTEEYVRNVGFSTLPGRGSTIQEYPKEMYFSGVVSFPLLDQQPTRRYQMFQTIHEIITHDYGTIVSTHDSEGIQTPRMSNVRHFHQPYNHQSAVSNNLVDGESPNEFGNRLKMIRRLILSIIHEYKQQYRDYSSRTLFGNSNVSAVSLAAFFNDFTPPIIAGIGIRCHAEVYALRELGANSPYVLDCQNLGPKSSLLRPQVLYQSENGLWTPIQMQRLEEELPFELPLFLLLSLRGAESINAITPPDVSRQFQLLQCIQEEGILCGDLIKFVNNIKFGNVGVFNREALGISSVITAARAERIFMRLAEIGALNDFKDLFEILINDVASRIDSRAIGFQVSLQRYGSSIYDSEIKQPENSLYGQELRLGRPLMDDMMTTLSPLFVPETSPITLYTEGLFIYYHYQQDLNPFEFVPLELSMSLVKRVIMWSPSIIGRRVKHQTRFEDEDVLRIPDENGEIHEYLLESDMPFTLIIVNAKTGQISPQDYGKLLRFFKEKKICFLYPELMVIMNRRNLDQTTEEDIMLYDQLKEVISGSPNRRVTLEFGDTVSKPYRLANTSEKLKFLYPISTIDQRDVIVRGLIDQVEKPAELKIGSWMSWAFGTLSGKDIVLREGERLTNDARYHDYGPATVEEQSINKLQLGMVNMNNELKILTSSEYITMPPLEQDVSRASVDIYI